MLLQLCQLTKQLQTLLGQEGAVGSLRLGKQGKVNCQVANNLTGSHSSDLCSGRDEAVAACRRCPAADDHHSPAFSCHSPEVPL